MDKLTITVTREEGDVKIDVEGKGFTPYEILGVLEMLSHQTVVTAFGKDVTVTTNEKT
jgi:hypothetical protein